MRKPNLTEAEEVQRQIEAERPEILRLGRQLRSVSAAIRTAVGELKAAREEQGLTLDDVAAAIGVGRGDLYNLEEDPTRSGSLLLMAAYANALEKNLNVDLRITEDQDQ